MSGRNRLVSWIVFGVLATGVICSANAPVTKAQSAHQFTDAPKTYTFAKLGLSLTYPTAWAVKTNLKTADVLTKANSVVKLDPTTTLVYANDGVAFVEIVTRNGTVSTKQFEQAVVAVFTDGATIQGKVTYHDTDNKVSINHHDYDWADAVLADSHGNGSFAATMLATQVGRTTVFIIGATNLKKSNTALRMKERNSVLTSLTFS